MVSLSWDENHAVRVVPAVDRANSKALPEGCLPAGQHMIWPWLITAPQQMVHLSISGQVIEQTHSINHEENTSHNTLIENKDVMASSNFTCFRF